MRDCVCVITGASACVHESILSVESVVGCQTDGNQSSGGTGIKDVEVWRNGEEVAARALNIDSKWECLLYYTQGKTRSCKVGVIDKQASTCEVTDKIEELRGPHAR
jgi:hypothetical protein